MSGSVDFDKCVLSYTSNYSITFSFTILTNPVFTYSILLCALQAPRNFAGIFIEAISFPFPKRYIIKNIYCITFQMDF